MKLAIIIVVVVIIVILGGGTYFFFKKESSLVVDRTSGEPPQSPTSSAQLLGLWQRNEEGGFVFFLEFKEREFCPGGSGSTPEKFICSQYLSYSVSENKIIVNDSPWAEWKVVGNKLELKPRSQTDTVIYIRVR